MKIRALLLATSLLSPAVFANNISFDYLEAGYVSLSVDDADFDLKGLGLKVSKSLSDNFVVRANYITTSDELYESTTVYYSDIPVYVTMNADITVSQLYAGFAYLWNLGENHVVEFAPYVGKIEFESDSRFVARASYNGDSASESESHSESEDASIYGLEANYHYAFNDALNVMLGVGYERADYDYEPENSSFYQVQLNYAFAENFAVNVAHRNLKDYHVTGLNLRYNF